MRDTGAAASASVPDTGEPSAKKRRVDAVTNCEPLAVFRSVRANISGHLLYLPPPPILTRQIGICMCGVGGGALCVSPYGCESVFLCLTAAFF